METGDRERLARLELENAALCRRLQRLAEEALAALGEGAEEALVAEVHRLECEDDLSRI